MNTHLLNLVLALAATEVAHNFIESQQVRKKVSWLKLALAGKPYHDSTPFEVDMRVKSYGLSLSGLIGMAAIFYLLFSWLSLSATSGLAVAAGLLVVAHLIVAYLLDKYHVEVGALTNQHKK